MSSIYYKYVCPDPGCASTPFCRVVPIDKFSQDCVCGQVMNETTCISPPGPEEPAKPTESEGQKFDRGKPQWSLIPWRELSEVAEILTFGAKKYSVDNWKSVRPTRRYIDATFRHLTVYADGEKRDAESGKAHLAHAICCLLFLMWFDNEGVKR